MPHLSRFAQSPLLEYLRRSFVLSGQWSSDTATLALDLCCGFHSFDGLEPVAAGAKLRLHGVVGVKQWHRWVDLGVDDGTSKLPAPSPISRLQPWPYPEECDICDAVLASNGWMPPEPVAELQLHQGSGALNSTDSSRLVIGLFHPEFGDHRVWLVIDHQDHNVLVDDEVLDLAAWASTYQSWIRGAAQQGGHPNVRENPQESG